MTETERWVNGACQRIVAGGTVRLYKDLYKDLRASLPCAEACSLIEGGLRLTRGTGRVDDPCVPARVMVRRGRAIAALLRLARWAYRRKWDAWERLVRGAAGEG